MYYHSLKTNQIFVQGISAHFKMIQISDAHINLIDERDGEKFHWLKANQYEEKFPNNIRNQSGELIRPYQVFAELMAEIAAKKPDLLIMTGDILQHPSYAALDFALKHLAKLTCPVFYTPGNHDWCFDNVPGLDDERRAGWEKLKPLCHHRMDIYAQCYNGLRFIGIDNSNYQINPQQLAFLKHALQEPEPTVLLYHIPISQPGARSKAVERYNAPLMMADKAWGAESRLQWGCQADQPSTLEFIELVDHHAHIVGSFCGHLHFNHVDEINHQKMQYINAPAYEGFYREIEFHPA